MFSGAWLGLFAGWAVSPIPNAAPGEDPTYWKDVAPVFAAKCTGCHSPGGFGPFSLTTYADARARADLVLNVAMLLKMPPTLVESDFGSLVRYPSLTAAETVMLQRWVRAGRPEGVGVIPKPTVEPQWPLGTPTLVLKNAQPISVSPEGAEAVRTVSFAVPLDEPRELVAFDFRPASPGSARRALLAFDPGSEADPFSPNGLDDRYLIGAWAIGYFPWRLPDSGGVRIRPGQKLRMQLLFHPTGKTEDGGYELALYFSDQPRRHQAVWKTIGSREFDITGKSPALTELVAQWRLPQSYQVASALAEARSLATNVALTARLGNDLNRSLFRVWRWDKRWAGAYNFVDPPLLTAGTELEAQFQYDNSNHGNFSLSLDQIKRLPERPTIHFGPKPEDELFWTHVQLVPYP